jgi:ATP synthase protein I
VSAHGPHSKPGKHKGAFVSEVQRRRERKEENERDKSFWISVGNMGTVGWSVSLPMVLGVLFGRWLDARLDSGRVFLLFFMLVGLTLGCILAWRMISRKI